MPRSSRRHRRLQEDDSDSDADEDFVNENDTMADGDLTEEQKIRNARVVQMRDLGSAARDFITSVDKGPRQYVNVKQLLEDRECNQEGTQAASKALENRSQLNAWANYGSTVKKDGTFENLTSIANGNAHRQNTREKLAAEGVFTLEDTYDDRSRRRGPPSAQIARGGLAAVANGRGRESGGRGGGFVGRGVGRNTPTNNATRPLDPAIDPDRPYGLKNRSKYQATSSSTKTLPKKPSTPAKVTTTQSNGSGLTMGPYKVTKPGAKMQSTNPTKRAPGNPLAKTNRPLLADPSNFMAFVHQKSQPQQQSSTNTVTPISGPDNIVTTLSSQTHSPVALSSAKLQPHAARPVVKSKEPSDEIFKIPVQELRFAPSGGSNVGTDGLPSPEKASLFSASAQSGSNAAQQTPTLGLGVSGHQMTRENPFTEVQRNEKDNQTSATSPDLMDTEVPEVKSVVLTPSPKLSDDLVTITKEQAVQLKTFNKLIMAKDLNALADYLDSLKLLAEEAVPHTVPASDTGADRDMPQTVLGERNLPARPTKLAVDPQESRWAKKPEKTIDDENGPYPASNPHQFSNTQTAVTKEATNSTGLASKAFGGVANFLKNPFSVREPLPTPDPSSRSHVQAIEIGSAPDASQVTEAPVVKPRLRTKHMTFDKAQVAAVNSTLTFEPKAKGAAAPSSAGSDHSAVLKGDLHTSKYAVKVGRQKDNIDPLAQKSGVTTNNHLHASNVPPSSNRKAVFAVFGDVQYLRRNAVRQLEKSQPPKVAPLPLYALTPPMGRIRQQAGPGFHALMKDLQEKEAAEKKEATAQEQAKAPVHNQHARPGFITSQAKMGYRDHAGYESEESEL